MASPFVSRTAAEETKEQRKMRIAAWKPNTARLKLQKSGACTVILANPDKRPAKA